MEFEEKIRSVLSFIMSHSQPLREKALQNPGEIILAVIDQSEHDENACELLAYLFQGEVAESFLDAIPEESRLGFVESLAAACGQVSDNSAFVIIYSVGRMPGVDYSGYGVITVYEDGLCPTCKAEKEAEDLQRRRSMN